jgi:hypothetical protein
MQAFFRGWRRKGGCVALVMALSVVGIWCRSTVIDDRIIFAIAGRRFTLCSWDGRIFSSSLTGPEWFDWRWTTSVNDREHFRQQETRFFEQLASLPIWENGRLALTFHYWILVLPLTLLSAYLILWKPRKRS